MSKSILIFCPGANYIDWWDETSIDKNGLGGTEIFFIELSRELAKRGHKVVLAGDSKERHISKDGVEYIPHNEAIHVYFKYEFDIGIFYYAKYIQFFSCKKNILTPTCETAEYCPGINVDNEHGADEIDKIVCLSRWHKKNVISSNNIEEDKIAIIPHGTNMMNDFTDVDMNNKKIEMVWSSRPERNFSLFMDYVYPKIKKHYPEFKVYFCSYVDDENYGKLQEKYKDEDVEFLGKVPQKELHELQKKCMIWAYPNIGVNISIDRETPNYYFHETFCLTALENVLAKNEVICIGDDKDGISTTLDGVKMLPGRIFDEYSMFFEEDYEAVGNAIAADALRGIWRVLNYFTDSLDESAKKFAEKYKWENIIPLWEKLFDE